MFVPQILGYYIISIDLAKISDFFLVDKNWFFGAYVKMITLLRKGGRVNDYSITYLSQYFVEKQS